MKLFLVIILLSISIFASFQSYIMMKANKAETQPYTLIHSEKNFEIRFYPSATMATIISSARSYKEISTTGFKKLAGYIYGDNATDKKINMTSPVHLDLNESAPSMSFVMPKTSTKYNLPKPNNPEVKIISTSEKYVAVFTYQGFASEEKNKQNTAILKKILKDNSIAYHGNFSFLEYNPPFQLFERKNEIIVAVNKDLK